MINVLDSKVGCFSDVHIGLYQDSPVWHDICLEFAKNVSSFYKKNKIKHIIIPGDIFHNRSEISVKTIHTAKLFFDYFKDFHIIISAGNHDSFFKERSDINSISIFDGWSNITIVDLKPLILNTKDNKKSVSFIPWGISCSDIPKTDICFGHFEINTFYMNTYKSCEKGEESKNLLEKSKFIISGHFHKKDHRKYSNGQILYVGSPYQHNFGDYGDDRGFYIIDLDKDKFEFYKNDFSPKFVKLDSTSIDKDNIENDIKNNFISLTLNSNESEQKINNILNKIHSFKPNNIKTEYIDVTEVKNNNENQYDSVDILKNIYDYVETLDIDCKEEVVNYLTETYNKTNK